MAIKSELYTAFWKSYDELRGRHGCRAVQRQADLVIGTLRHRCIELNPAPLVKEAWGVLMTTTGVFNG
jgi:hypothetical protein